MNIRYLWIVVALLFVALLGYMAWLLLAPGPSTDAGVTVQPTTVSQPTTTVPAATSSTQTPAPANAQVSVSSPVASSTVSSPLTVTGSAPNNWYFEAVFPIQVRDAADNVIGRGQGQAKTDWTVPGQVAFSATVTIDAGYQGPATLILMKDNPSGLPQNDDSYTVPIVIR